MQTHTHVIVGFAVMVCVYAWKADAQQPSSSEAASRAVNAFGVALQKQSAGAAGNSLVSPWSLQSALAMTYAGTTGQTRDEMAAALSYPEDEAALHRSFQALQEAFETRAEVGTPNRLHAANRIYYEQSLHVEQRWLELTRLNYRSEAQAADFIHAPASAMNAINAWVNAQTNGKISRVIPENGLGALPRLVIVNALHFDFPWDEQFTKSLTQNALFHLTPGLAKEVPLMFKQHRIKYAQRKGYQIAALPYAGGTMQFVVLLPDRVDGLADMMSGLTPEIVAECAALPTAEVRLSLPRLKMEPMPQELTRSLEALGMKRAFDVNNAEFSRLAPGVSVSKIYHQTFLELDEEGTKAASSSAVVIRTKNGVPHDIPHMVVKADHPFLFMIQHIPSGACLFIGKVTDPAPGIVAVTAPVESQPRAGAFKK